jgi:hypothetical protein
MSLLTRQLNRQAGRLPRSARLGPGPCRAQPPQPLTHTRSLQVIGPRAAQFSTPFGEHAAYLIDPLEVAVAEAVPASRGPPVRARSRTCAVSCRSRLVRSPLVQPNAARSQYGPNRSLGTRRLWSEWSAAARARTVGIQRARCGVPPGPSIGDRVRSRALRR